MKLKIIMALMLLGFTFIACAESNAQPANDETGLIWHENIETAVEVAKVENKDILINFTGSDWCPWCIKLSDEVFTQKEFAEYAKENLVLVRLDFPRYKKLSEEAQEYNQQQASKYGVRGFPTVILLDSNGKPVGQSGYAPGGAAKYVEQLKGVFK